MGADEFPFAGTFTGALWTGIFTVNVVISASCSIHTDPITAESVGDVSSIGVSVSEPNSRRSGVVCVAHALKLTDSKLGISAWLGLESGRYSKPLSVGCGRRFRLPSQGLRGPKCTAHTWHHVPTPSQEGHMSSVQFRREASTRRQNLHRLLLTLRRRLGFETTWFHSSATMISQEQSWREPRLGNTDQRSRA